MLLTNQRHQRPLDVFFPCNPQEIAMQEHGLHTNREPGTLVNAGCLGTSRVAVFPWNGNSIECLCRDLRRERSQLQLRVEHLSQELLSAPPVLPKAGPQARACCQQAVISQQI